MTNSTPRVTNRESLPSFSSPETDALDWKRQVNSTERQELAKDMAAMANVAGGCIIIGVKEGSADVRAAIQPLTHQDALSLARAYEHSARDLISPPPRVDACAIELEHDGSTKWVLAVNISPTEAIFCAVKIVNDSAGQRREPSWLIPLRVASQTKLLSPAEAQLLTVEKLRSATQRTLSLIEAWQNDLELRQRIRRFEEFMTDESHYDVRFPNLGSEEGSLGLEYTIRPVRTASGMPLQDKGEMRRRWLVEVVGPAHESVMTDEDLRRYESSPIRDGEYYYCEFYNDSWHMTDGGVSEAYAFYMSGKVGPAEYMEPANEYVGRHNSSEYPTLSCMFDLALDLQGKRLKGGGSGNQFSVAVNETGGLFLRINNSPPKSMYLTNPINTWDDTGWYFEIEKLRGHGDLEVQTNIKNSIQAELQSRNINIPRRRWYETPKAYCK